MEEAKEVGLRRLDSKMSRGEGMDKIQRKLRRLNFVTK